MLPSDPSLTSMLVSYPGKTLARLISKSHPVLFSWENDQKLLPSRCLKRGRGSHHFLPGPVDVKVQLLYLVNLLEA